MSSILQQLNNESILLMYLAGELAAEDRQEVEQMLASDAQAREHLEELRAAFEGAEQALQLADKRERLVLSETSAARRIGRAVRAWQARRLSAGPQPDAARRRLRFPWWCYPTASAAAILLALVSWWGMSDHVPRGLRAPSDAIAQYEGDDAGGGATTEVVSIDPLDTFAIPADERDAILDEAEAELYALSEPPTDLTSGLLSFGESDEQ